MNLRPILLVLCLAGNVLLATVLFRHGMTASPSVAPSAGKISTPVVSRVEASPSIATDTTNTVDVTAMEFQWAQVAAPDFALYIKQLRAFGAPEPKVHEIIFGAVDALYRPQRGALRPPLKKPDETKFWVRRNYYGSNLQGTKEQRAQLRVLQKAEMDLLKSLFGADIYELMAKDSGSPSVDWMEKQYGFIPKELREQVQDLDQQMNEAKQEIYAQNEGGYDPDQQEDLKKVEKKYHDELAKILTPEQLLEWDLRHSDTANQLKNDLSAFDPNEDEFRALFKYQQDLVQLRPDRDPDADPVKLTAEERKALAEKQKALDADLAATVGTNRVAEYKLEQDYVYRSLIESGVAKESVFKLDEMKKQAQAAAEKIRGDKTLTSDQRTEALAAIRTETQDSINGLLGDKRAKSYTGQGGYWLNNIAPMQPAITTQ